MLRTSGDIPWARSQRMTSSLPFAAAQCCAELAVNPRLVPLPHA